jgi:hypothetical protein
MSPGRKEEVLFVHPIGLGEQIGPVDKDPKGFCDRVERTTPADAIPPTGVESRSTGNP